MKRHVLEIPAGQPGYENALAAILSAVQPSDVIAVPDPETEKQVREAALKFGLGSDEEDVGIGIEIMAGTGLEVEFDERVLEYVVQAGDQGGFMDEVEDMVEQASFDDQTIFVVADRRKIGWLFAAVAKYPDRVGKVRATIMGSNTIVSSLEDLPPVPVPKLDVKINAENLSAAMVKALGDAGFAVGYKEHRGVLEMKGGDEDEFVEIFLMVREGDSLVPTEVLRVGVVGQETRIALPIPKSEKPKMELTGAKPEHPEEKTGEPGPGYVDPARTDGKNIVDG